MQEVEGYSTCVTLSTYTSRYLYISATRARRTVNINASNLSPGKVSRIVKPELLECASLTPGHQTPRPQYVVFVL